MVAFQQPRRRGNAQQGAGVAPRPAVAPVPGGLEPPLRRAGAGASARTVARTTVVGLDETALLGSQREAVAARGALRLVRSQGTPPRAAPWTREQGRTATARAQMGQKEAGRTDSYCRRHHLRCLRAL